MARQHFKAGIVLNIHLVLDSVRSGKIPSTITIIWTMWKVAWTHTTSKQIYMLLHLTFSHGPKYHNLQLG